MMKPNMTNLTIIDFLRHRMLDKQNHEMKKEQKRKRKRRLKACNGMNLKNT